MPLLPLLMSLCSCMQVGAAWGGLWGSTLRSWIPAWNIQPGVYGIMAASSVLAGVFRCALCCWPLFSARWLLALQRFARAQRNGHDSA